MTLSLDWSDSTYYQGEVGNVTITLHSNCNNELNITWIGIHFAWMKENDYFKFDLKNNPVRIMSQGSHEFKPIFFLVTLEASVGWNEYYVRINCEEHHSNKGVEETWTSGIENIYIHDFYEKMYYDNIHVIESKLISAKEHDFESQYALSTLNQAENEFNLSRSLADKDEWPDTCSHMTNAANLIEQAYSYEIMHWKTKVENSIDDAQDKIEGLMELWSPAAKKTSDKAKNELDSSKSEYAVGSILDLQRAFNHAQESISLSKQAQNNESNFRYVIKFGTVGIGVTVALIVFARMRRALRRKPQELGDLEHAEII